MLTQLAGPQHNSQVDFSAFDDEDNATNMVKSLNLDVDDEPRRLNAASRANSVRFDESAKQSQWNHGPRSSIDVFPRAPSGLGGLGGHPMFERSTSHKSDGRQSSAGQSASGRANSLGLDSSHLLVQSTSDLPGLMPGLSVLGTVPSIVRCWLNRNFRHDALLYAAVCTGAYRSMVEMRLLEGLGLAGEVRQDIGGNSKIKLPVYLPEAISYPASSRPNSPAPALPTITVDFLVVDRSKDQPVSKAIQIFLGSDTLRQHCADVLLSTNGLILYDDDRNKLSVPLVRPENDETFKSLSATSSAYPTSRQPFGSAPGSLPSQDSLKSLTNGFETAHSAPLPSQTLNFERKVESRQEPPRKQEDHPPIERAEPVEEKSAKPTEEESHARKPSLEPLRIAKSDRDTVDENPALSASSKTNASPAIWSNWRRDGSVASGEWANTSRNASTSYQRPGRDVGMKVLKPSSARQTPLKSSSTPSQSPNAPQSRFFDEGRKRSGPEETSQSTRSTSGEGRKGTGKETGESPTPPTTAKPRSANPIGGASAFGWLNSGQK